MRPSPHLASELAFAWRATVHRLRAPCHLLRAPICGNGTSRGLVQDMGSFRTNEMGDWHRYRFQLTAVHKLNEYPHRRSEIRHLVPYFVCSGDEVLLNDYTAKIRRFAVDLPLSYEEEKADEGRLTSLRERMTLFSEQADPVHFKAEPAEDGKHIKIFNDPPSLKQEKYRVRQQEHEQLNEFASIAVWAQKALDEGKAGERIQIDEAVAKAKLWDEPGLFETDDADAFEGKQRASAIVGAAFVAARYSNDEPGSERLNWCLEVFDRVLSATRKPSQFSMRGSILTMDPLVFAAHGYAALLAKGQDVEHCERALLRLSLDPLEAIQSAVFAAASQFANSCPDFYWVLLDAALAQCIVANEQIPDYHSILFDEKEAELKQNIWKRAIGFLESGTVPDLPAIPLPWVKSDGPLKRTQKDTKGYGPNKTKFLFNVATKVLFHAPLESVLGDATKRAKFLKMVGELLDWTIQEIVPPFADNRRDRSGHTPFEWCVWLRILVWADLRLPDPCRSS